MQGDKNATAAQNAFVFYDRNDQVFMEDIDVWYLHGRALYSGVIKNTKEAFMREAHLRSLRLFEDGTTELSVVEVTSQGRRVVDASNEIRITQIDIYGAYGPSFVIRNNGSSVIRGIGVDTLRIEGREDGKTFGDLLNVVTSE